MSKKKLTAITKEALAAARAEAADIQQKIEHQPTPTDLLTTLELADAAPFFFVLRAYITQLKAAREAAGLTLADVSQRSGLAVESLSRLETGAQTNPTWKTLGLYAKAVDRRPLLVAEEQTTEQRPAKNATETVAVMGTTASPAQRRIGESIANNAIAAFTSKQQTAVAARYA